MIYMYAKLEYCSISKRDLFCVSVLFDLSPKKNKKKKKNKNNKEKCKLTLRVSKNADGQLLQWINALADLR